MSLRHDGDIASMSLKDLRHEVMKLRRAVRKHRNTNENARCWHNDLTLYAVLPENDPPGRMRGTEEELLRNCKRYIRRQQCATHGCKK